jgi:hypothetical protein
MANETEGENERDRPSSSSVAFDLARPALDALTRTTEWYAKAALTWQNEIMRFATERLGSASKLQQDWAVSMLNDYADEARRLVRIAIGMEREGAEITQRAIEEETEAAAGMARRGMREARRTVRGTEKETEEAAEMAKAGSSSPRRTGD